jgi:methyltransferase (TIGR00027 family)
VFEVDRTDPQAWKRRRPIELGFGIPAWLRLVPVDFEASESWCERLAAAGFDAGPPAVVASTGVSMYLTKEANAATLRQIALLAPGSTLAMTFLLPLELIEEEERPSQHLAGRSSWRLPDLHSPRRPFQMEPTRFELVTSAVQRRRSPS